MLQICGQSHHCTTELSDLSPAVGLVNNHHILLGRVITLPPKLSNISHTAVKGMGCCRRQREQNYCSILAHTSDRLHVLSYWDLRK
jgi:hypothetical protein